jgi:hypothetical protein
MYFIIAYDVKSAACLFCLPVMPCLAFRAIWDLAWRHFLVVSLKLRKLE